MNAVESSVCSESITETYYHNGGSSDPVVADVVYSDSGMTTVLTDGFYKIGVNTYIEVSGGAGAVLSVSSCITCRDYTLWNDGGSGDIVFVYTACDGTLYNPTVSLGGNVTVCAQSIDTVPSGGTVTTGGFCT